MIIFERLGGWGLANTLFQIATTVSVAKLNNTDYGFPSDCYFRFARYNPNALGKIFFKKELPWVDINLIKNQDFERWGFGGVGFKPLPTTYKNMIIDGFFQSEKYFIQHRDYILELFEIKDEYKLYIQSKYKHLIDEDACSLHVRRGDYANARELIILNKDYYDKATEIIGKNKLFVIFSDDIDWCKKNLDYLPNKFYIEEKNDLLEMYLMSLFKKHIIANSTFSWWGAWMADNSKVIMPNPSSNWFSEEFYKEAWRDNVYTDLICSGWEYL